MEGFFKVDNRVMDELKFENSCEFGVYMILMRYGNGGQIAYPSIEFMREKLRTSNRKISSAINSLEKRGLIKIVRVHRSFNRYMIVPIQEVKPLTTEVIAPTKTEVLPSTVEEYKEQYININNRREVLSEIYSLISEGTGDNVFIIQQVFTGRGLTDDELRTMRDRIGESDFLMGRLIDNKPTVRHYDSQKQIDKVRMGYYRNSVKEKSSNRKSKVIESYKPPYHYEFQEREVIHHEPNY